MASLKWHYVIPMYINAIQKGSNKAREIAIAELIRLGDLVDEMNERDEIPMTEKELRAKREEEKNGKS